MTNSRPLLFFEAALLAWCVFDGRRHRQTHARMTDRFLATVSHELRTPLNAIIGWTQLLKSGTLSPADTARAIDAIDRNARAQTRLVNDLLDVSNMMQGRLSLNRSVIDVRPICDAAVDAARTLGEGRQIAVDGDIDTRPLPVLADASRLTQVLGNLLSNAIKFSPPQSRVLLQVTREDDSVRISVRDQGKGIAATDLPHVFERFVQGASDTMRVGLGLGLALVKEIVTLHAGEVTAESKGRGQGATMTVRLPLASSQQAT